MKNPKLGKTTKIILIVGGAIVAPQIIFTVWFGIAFFWAKVNQVTQAEADKVCQEFFEQVKSDITAVPDYTVVNEGKSCSPSQDEAGFTDYYFNSNFKVTKTGNETVEGIKANINNLSDNLPKEEYPVSIWNQPGTNGQPETICVWATKQIQENGEVYHSSPPQRHPDYIEHSEFNSDFTGGCADL